MKTLQLIAASLFLLVMTSCNGQPGRDNPLAANTKKEMVPDTVKPKINYKVNKEYDDKGNLIRYDSTYSYVYSGPGGFLTGTDPDSLFKAFRFPFPSLMQGDSVHRFFSDPFFKSDPFFRNGFFTDPFLNNGFPAQDFLQQQMEFHRRFEEEMKKQMKEKDIPLKKGDDETSVTRQI